MPSSPVQLVEARARLVAHDKVNAAVDQVFAPPPAGSHAAGMSVVLKDVALIAVHLGVAAGGQAGQPSANDDQRSSVICPLFGDDSLSLAPIPRRTSDVSACSMRSGGTSSPITWK